MRCVLLVLLVGVLYLSCLARGEDGTTPGQEPTTVEAPTSAEDGGQHATSPALSALLALEGGGAVTPAAGRSTGTTDKARTLSEDPGRLLDAVDEGAARGKSSSVVARKGAPPPVVDEAVSVDVQELFGDDTKLNGSSSNCSGSSCSQSDMQGKPSPVIATSTTATSITATSTTGTNTTSTTSTTATATGQSQSDDPVAVVLKPTVTTSVSKSEPVAPHDLSVPTSNTIMKNTTTAPNSTHNAPPKKKTVFKPGTTSDIDESKEPLLTTDTPASKGDYIIPIIGIIFAVPMVVILFMFFYKRSAEFWERRHYKRMDFLIDGMYND